MQEYLPDMYRKDIFHIPYQKLKEKNIKALVFDLDNTVAPVSLKRPTKDVIFLFETLKKDFSLFLVSNSFKKRVAPFGRALGISFYALAMKPRPKTLKKIMVEKNLKKEEIAIIGDQFMTDIALGKKMGLFTVFVDPLEAKEFKITSINRHREKRLIKAYQEKALFERGKYYDER